jgi:hypothetical protein
VFSAEVMVLVTEDGSQLVGLMMKLGWLIVTRIVLMPSGMA